MALLSLKCLIAVCLMALAPLASGLTCKSCLAGVTTCPTVTCASAQTHCVKTTTTIASAETVIRACGAKPSSVSGTCSTTEVAGTSTKICYCNTDDCDPSDSAGGESGSYKWQMTLAPVLATCFLGLFASLYASS